MRVHVTQRRGACLAVAALAVSVAAALAPAGAMAAPAPKPNATCTTVGASTKIDGVLYSCTKDNYNYKRWTKALFGVDCASKPTSKVQIRMTALPILSNAAYYLGVDKGFFYKQGLDPVIQQVPSPAAALASLQGGNTDFAFTTVVTMFTARDAGVPAKFVAPAAGIRPKAYQKFLAKVPGYTTDTTAVLVMPASGIARPKDLENKTVAIPARNDQSEITIAESVRQDGGNPSTIKWVPMAIPDGVNALVAGKIDAAFGVDPLNDKAVGQGAKVIAYPGLIAFKEGTTSGWAATDAYVKANRETVARFQCAIRETNQYANEHPVEVKAKSAELTKQPFENLKMSVVPRYYSTVSLQDLSRIGDFMYKLGYLKNKPKYSMSILTP